MSCRGGGRRPIDRGELQLFRPTTTTAVTELAYLLEFSDAGVEAYCFTFG